MPNIADLMSSAKNYPTGQPAPRTILEPPTPELQAPPIDPQAFGQTLAAFLAQAGLADPSSAQGITKGSTPGQFTLPWGSATLHLLSTGAKDTPSAEELVIVPQEAYDQFGKTRSSKKRQALLDSIVQGTQAAPSTILGGALT